ncbi:VanW family protein [Patescibacteria group bacterium]|nr:VanW family protein [Patescibacteria group bacterium]
MEKNNYFIFLLLALFLVPSLSLAAEPESNFSSLDFQESFFNKIPAEISLQAGESIYPLSKKIIESWIEEKSTLSYRKDYASEIENTDLCQGEYFIACRLSWDIKRSFRTKKISRLLVDQKLISSFLEDLERQANKDPEDAKFKMDANEKVSLFSLGSPGLKLDKEKSLQIILDYLKNDGQSSQLKLSFVEITPSLSINSIDNLGITSLIGEGRSNFRGSPKNRIFNIKVAASRFDGILIKPGEEFSFVKILGEVDGEHGYLPELVIKKDKTEPEFGGGICQVSTTTFRAAINSGLKITARKNHAYPVQYYNPQGMDATVYIPRPDLRFVNNTPAHILIQTKIEGTELIFKFFGTDDGRKIEIIGPKITERKPDGSMKATFSQKVSDKDGALFIDDTFNSNYDSPNNYPHPGAETVLTTKPSGWSDKEWSKYKKEHKI